MPSFTPPTTTGDSLAGGDETHPGHALFRHYVPLVRGVNVFKLNDGSYHGDVGDEFSPDNWDDVDVVYYGGHGPYQISTAEAAALTAAGYGAYIT